MTWTLRVQPRARLEMIDAAAWYAEQSGGLADAFMTTLEATLRRLEESPLQYQIVHGELRRAKLRRFPYLVIYNVSDEQVTVVACVHAGRDPRRWKQRR
jgi:toxin ParE1/3/4